MAKKWIALLLLACVLCGVLSGCKQKITAQEAAQIVLAELGEDVQPDQAPHVHQATYRNEPCFNVFVTVDQQSFVYIVSDTGDILLSGPSDHQH